MAEFILELLNGVLVALITGVFLLSAYAHQRAARLRNTISSVVKRIQTIVEDIPAGEDQKQEMLWYLEILDREMRRIDENILCLQVRREIELKRLCWQTEKWRKRLQEYPPMEIVNLVIRIRIDSEGRDAKEFREYIMSLRTYADSLGAWSFFEE